MDFPLYQLHVMNGSKPLVRVKGIDGWLQWDTCNLEGLPPKRERGSMTDMGKIPKGQYNNLPKLFTATTGGRFFISNIYMLKPASYEHGT
mgnify:FL=1